MTNQTQIKKGNFWKKLTITQKLSLILAASFVLALPFALIASQQQTRTTPKANININPTSPFFTPTLGPNQVTLEEALTTKGKFMPQDEIIITVKNVPVFNEDLNYLLYSEYLNDFTSASPLNTELKIKVMQRLIDEEILIQTQRLNNPTSVNLPVKTFAVLNPGYYVLRRKTIQQLSSQMDISQEKVSGAVITYWYHNVEPPKNVPLDQAKTMAENKIKQIIADIGNGKTFEQAGLEAKNDIAWKEIDPSYDVNNYFTFEGKSVANPIFGYKELNDAIKLLKPGDISPIILHSKTVNTGNSKGEEFYALIKVTKRENVGEKNAVDTVKNEAPTYAVPSI